MLQYRPTLRRIRLIGKLLLSALLVCCLTDVACSEGKPGSTYDVTMRRLDPIPPGTIIDKEAPKGWSNLVIKSYSRPAEGDVSQLSPAADRLTRLLFTAILADVKADKSSGDKRYKLAKVAVGLGMGIRGKDTIITPDTQNRLGANLGFLARIVLRTAQEKLGEITVLVRSKTLLLFDSPGYMLVEARHKPIVLRYAVLVEERTGRLNTLVWALERGADGKYSGPLGAIQCLPPNLTDDCRLHVDSHEFSVGQPTEKAFAMMTPPKGHEEIKVSDDLQPLVSRPRFSSAVAAELEGKLRALLPQAKEE
jgi:hypothetical protein